MDFHRFECKCGETIRVDNRVNLDGYTNSLPTMILTDKDYECPTCVDKRLGKVKVLTVQVDTKSIHFQFRGKEEGMSKAAHGVDRIYEQFKVR